MRSDLKTLLLIFAATCNPISARATTQQDIDLTCAVTSAAEMGLNVAGSAEYNAALRIHLFYLGRLSGRDDYMMWSDVIKSKLVELGKAARSFPIYGRCIAFVTSKL